MTLVDDERIGEARLTQLGWLSSPEVDSTISLLALVQTSSASYFRTWRVERDRFTLSDAFTALEGKAVQPTQLDETWVRRRDTLSHETGGLSRTDLFAASCESARGQPGFASPSASQCVGERAARRPL